MTVSVERGPRRRTAAATEATKRRRTERMVVELGARLDQLDDEWLTTFACAVVEEVDRRGLWDLMNERWRERNG